MRYTDETKAEVVNFVKKYNEDNGRGGQTAAVEKFKVSPISIANWLTKAGEKLPGKGGRKKAAKGKPGRPKGTKVATVAAATGKASTAKSENATAGSTEKTLARLSEIHAEIESLQEEFDSLKKAL